MRLALEIVTLVAGALAMLRLMPPGHRRGRPARPPVRPDRPADLERIERVVATGGATKADVHSRLRPLLREIALARLLRRGVRLDQSPDAARALLGDELWEIVRPGRPRPEDLRAPGVSFEQLTAIVDRLERL